jgi:Gram-negative bacterial TonB protein C-terminal
MMLNTKKIRQQACLVLLASLPLQALAQDHNAPYQPTTAVGHVCPHIVRPVYANGPKAFVAEVLKHIDLKPFQDPKRVHDSEVSFVVDRFGKINTIEAKGSSAKFDTALKNALKAMNPIFQPGTSSGLPAELFYSQNFCSESGPEVLAKYEDGLESFQAKIAGRTQISDSKKEYTSTASFVILPQGSLSQLKVEGSNPSFNQAVEESIKSIKKRWEPAVEDGKNISAEIKIPFKMKF